ncbi:MAG TPA: carbohydrate ABC transporter permease [Spirochaetia bacterium]|nr:carbohydrate ABC transporter permease [Spirochaetia bacterium]
MAHIDRGILSPNEYKTPAMRLAYGFFLLLGVGLTLVMFYPFFWVLTGALKDSNEIFLIPPTFLPSNAHWDNFFRAFTYYEFPRMIWNTLVLFAGYFVSRVLVVTLAAYALARMKLPFRRGFYLLFLATLMLPTVAYLVPSYLVIQKLPFVDFGLLDSNWSIWLPAGADSFSLLLMKGFFDDIPRELSEAGRIDGASEGGILVRIIVPLSKPILAVIAIFAFLTIWNDFFWQRLVLISPENWTISVMLWFRSTVVGATPPINIQLAAMFLSILPPMLLFLVSQKNITTGVSMTGIKG